MSAHANYRIEHDDLRVVILRDVGPWDKHLTITNDAEWVVAQVIPTLRGRTLFYYDSEGGLDQLVVKFNRFFRFSACQAEPTEDDMQAWEDKGGAEATDGCWVEPDGECEHHHLSWLIVKGLI